MLELFAKHGSFDLSVCCKGDTDVDFHHSVEDVGIVLGQAFSKAVGDCKGINRFGYFLLPMDEALVMVSLDISGRSGFYENMDIPGYRVKDFDVELVPEFFEAFSRNSKMTLHIRKICGTNAHHIIEAVFKCFARSLKQAVTLNADAPDSVPSTKGTLTGE